MGLTRVRRLVDRAAAAAAAEEAAPLRARVFLPCKDGERGTRRFGAIVIYDPDDPPPELREKWARQAACGDVGLSPSESS